MIYIKTMKKKIVPRKRKCMLKDTIKELEEKIKFLRIKKKELMKEITKLDDQIIENVISLDKINERYNEENQNS